MVKHVFAEHVVLQFNCNNTLSDQLLKRVSVRVEPGDDADPDAVKVERSVPLAALPYAQDGVTYVVLRVPGGAARAPTLTFTGTLHFTVCDVDQAGDVVDEDGYEDEYELEEFALVTADYVRPTFAADFGAEWDAQADTAAEAVETYALSSIDSLAAAVVSVTRYLGMQAAEGSDLVKPNAKKHILYLSGQFVGGVPVLVRVRMRLAKDATGVNMEGELRARRSVDDRFESEKKKQIIGYGFVVFG